MELALKNKWFGFASFSILFLSVALFAWTGRYELLAAPFAFLFFILMGLNWKTAYWILLLTIPASIEVDFANNTMVLTLPDQPIMWLFLLLFGVMWCRNPMLLPKWWWRDKLVFVTVLQFLWMTVAVICSKMLFFSVKFFLVKSWIMVCFFIFPVFIFKEKKDFVKAFMLMLVPIVMATIVILIHHSMLGFRFDKVQHSLTNLFYNHVDYSAVLSMFFPLLLVAYPLTKGRSIVTRWTLILIIAIFLTGIWFSFARAAVIALVFAIIIGVAIRMKLVNFIMPVFYGLLTLLLVYMINNNKYMDFRPDYNNTYMHKDFADHVIATFRGKDMSSMERLYRWIAAIRMSNAEPVTGVGPRAFYYYYKPYAVSSFKTYVSRNPEQSTTHNYYLYMLVEQGYPAMILYALLIPLIFAKAQRVYHRFKDKFYRAVTIGLAMCIGAGYINNFFSELIETHKVGALFYIPVALLIILDKKSRDMEKEEDGKAIVNS